MDIPGFMGWLAATVDWVAIGTFALAGGTVFLALQARAQAREGQEQLRLTQEIERSRRAEIAISTANPLAAWLDEPSKVNDPATGLPLLKLRVKNVGSELVAAITATIRSDEVSAAQTIGRDALVPGQEWLGTLGLAPYLAYDDPSTRFGERAALGHLDVVLESHGLLNQRVIQTYRLRLDELLAGRAAADAWHQSRLQIVPGPEGIHATDVRYEP